MTALEIGSDIGGSLGNTAHYCGVCSLKPTYGLLSVKGHVPQSLDMECDPADLACAGPMARSVEDLELAMSVLAPSAQKAPAKMTNLADVKVAFWRKEAAFPLSKDCGSAVLKIRKLMEKAGSILADTKPQIDAHQLIETYQHLLMPILFQGFPAPILRLSKANRALLKVINHKRRYTFLDAVINAVQPISQLQSAQKKRDLMKQKCNEFFAEWDLLISPVTATPAPLHDNRRNLFSRMLNVDNKRVRSMHQLDWIALATVCHLPAAVIPVASTAEGLPLGIQIIGATGDDMKVLKVARLIQNAL